MAAAVVSEKPINRGSRFAAAVQRFNRSPKLVGFARRAREQTLGDDELIDHLSTARGRPSDRAARQLVALRGAEHGFFGQPPGAEEGLGRHLSRRPLEAEPLHQPRRRLVRVQVPAFRPRALPVEPYLLQARKQQVSLDLDIAADAGRLDRPLPCVPHRPRRHGRDRVPEIEGDGLDHGAILKQRPARALFGA